MTGIHRIKQWTMGRATGIISHEPQVIKGKGSLLKVPDMLAKAGHERVMIVTTPGTIRRSTLNSFLYRLEEAGIQATVFSDVVPDPTIECVEQVVTAYALGDCKAFVAIGGGSVMDCAKAAAARVVRPDTCC